MKRKEKTVIRVEERYPGGLPGRVSIKARSAVS